MYLDSQIKSRSGRSPLEIMIEAARVAGIILVRNFRKGLRASRKGRGNFLSEADLLSEKTIMKVLKEEFPGCNFMSEESFPQSTSGSRISFIIDPLDGTNNYCFGLPYFCINIALVQDGKITEGLVYDPLRKETFWAQAGKGAYLGAGKGRYLHKRSIIVSAGKSLQESLLGFDFGYSEEHGREVLKVVRSLWPGVHSFRALGSSSLGLCYVASGRMDLYFHRFLFPWDIASGLLLIKEAGGVVTDWEGKEAELESSQIIAGNPEVHQQFMSWLNQHPGLISKA